eukprot:2335923-Lingulodinium_polyedra.AAC.1
MGPRLGAARLAQHYADQPGAAASPVARGGRRGSRRGGSTAGPASGRGRGSSTPGPGVAGPVGA